MSGNHKVRRDATQETPIFHNLETRLQQIAKEYAEIVPHVSSKALERKFGLGDQPRITRSVFKRLEASSKVHGPAASRIIWRTAYRASGKSHPLRWFVCVVLDELSRNGLAVGERE